MQTIGGLKLEFFDTLPRQNLPPNELKMGPVEMEAIDVEIARLLDKRVIVESEFQEDQFVSNVFARPKKDGKFRMILDLSKLNEFITYRHFKMDTFDCAIKLVTPGSFLASIDLRDAYYTVPVATEHTKFLKFSWRGILYQFLAVPNGLSSAPREFTKLLKPPFSFLRRLGHVITGYIDDTLLIALTKDLAYKAVADTVKVLTDLGFVIHPRKSVVKPVQKLVYLGFIIDTQSMKVKLTPEKCSEIKELCIKLKRTVCPTIHDVASVTGKLVAACPAAQYGPLHYRELEKDKTEALTKVKRQLSVSH